MRKAVIVAIAGVTIAPLAIGQDDTKFQCSYGELQRRVEIYSEPGQAVPCEVHYFKDTEAPGESQVLWSATNDASYCAAKTSEFVTKLEGWGWSCGASAEAATDDAMEAPEPEAVRDDTDVLSPGDTSGS